MWRCRPTICRTSEAAPDRRFDQLGLFLAGVTNLSPRLCAHVTFSVGWLGAVAAFLVLSIAGLTSHDAGVVRGAYLSMDLISRFVTIPTCFAALATGLLQTLGTPWACSATSGS
jgi:hypothetical protein